MTRRGLGWALLPAVGLLVPAARRCAGLSRDCAFAENADEAVAGFLP